MGTANIIFVVLFSVFATLCVALILFYIFIWSRSGKTEQDLFQIRKDSESLAISFRKQFSLLFLLPKIFSTDDLSSLKDPTNLFTYISLLANLVCIVIIFVTVAKMEQGGNGNVDLLLGSLVIFYIGLNTFVATRMYVHRISETEEAVKEAFSRVRSIHFDSRPPDSRHWSVITTNIKLEINNHSESSPVGAFDLNGFPLHDALSSTSSNDPASYSDNFGRGRHFYQGPSISSQSSTTPSPDCYDRVTVCEKPSLSSLSQSKNPTLQGGNITIKYNGPLHSASPFTKISRVLLKYRLQPQYGSFRRSPLNIFRVCVRIINFMQLVSLPLRDLMKLPYFSAQTNVGVLQSVDTLTTLMLTGLPTVESKILTITQFFTVVGITGLMLIIGIGILCLLYNSDSNKEKNAITSNIPVSSRIIGQGWLLHFTQIVEIIYLPILHTYLSLVKCLVDYNFTVGKTSDAERCMTVLERPVWFTVLSIVGYTVAYIIMTFYLASKPERPAQGDIAYASWSMVVLKNLSLLLVINYSFFLPYPLARGIVSVLIISAMLIYQGLVGSCYTWSINHWRTASYVAILWACIIVSLLTMGNLDWIYTWMNDAYVIIISGWGFVFIIFALTHYFYHPSV